MPLALVLAHTAFAHEVRPALLEINQTGPHSYSVLWKQPTMGEVAIHLVPHISNGWLEQRPVNEYSASGFLVMTWKITSDGADPLANRTVSIEGLDKTITDAFIRVRLSENRHIDAFVRPEHPSLSLQFGSHGAQSAAMYLQLGITHILTGIDHLLFVLGLLLIVPNRWMLLKTVSAFTVAHSITLAAATLLHVMPSTALLNTLIALSILFLGPEIVRYHRGGTSLTLRRPWVIAFCFGLLHGFGFASGLLSLGLPRSEIPLALLIFNVGVELGQIAFIVLILSLERAFRLMEIRWPRPLASLPTYAVGVFGAYWTILYGAQLLGGSP
jgi:HupE / UreJ protein